MGTKHTLLVKNTTINYWEYNADQKTTIVMIHGFRGTHNGLEKIISQLSDYRVIAPDLPGFGSSSPMNAAHTIENYALFLETFIKTLNLTSIVLLGHSMGSAVAACLAARYPSIMRHVIFVNPIAISPNKGASILRVAPTTVYHHVAGKLLPEKIGTALLGNKYIILLGSIAMTTTKDRQLRKWIHATHRTYMRQFNNRTSLLEAYHSSSRSGIIDYADQLTMPILIIAGKKDTIAPIKSQRQLAAKLANATLVELDNVGHIIHYEKDAEAATAIRAFLQQ